MTTTYLGTVEVVGESVYICRDSGGVLLGVHARGWFTMSAQEVALRLRGSR